MYITCYMEMQLYEDHIKNVHVTIFSDCSIHIYLIVLSKETDIKMLWMTEQDLKNSLNRG